MHPLKPPLVLLFGLLLALPACAQFGNLSGPVSASSSAPPSLTYRAGNANTLGLIFKSDSVLITPTASQTITGEIRPVGSDKVIGSVSFVLIDTAKGLMNGVLPSSLTPGSYTLGLRRQKANLADFYAGVAYLNLIRIGEVSAVTGNSSLSVSMNNTTYQITAKADNTPSVQLAAYYANLAEQAAQRIGALSKIFVLSSIPPSGYLLTHNRGTTLLTAVFYRADTRQIDPLWQAKVIIDSGGVVNLNQVRVVGPPGETFSGQAVLNFSSVSTSN